MKVKDALPCLMALVISDALLITSLSAHSTEPRSATIATAALYDQDTDMHREATRMDFRTD
jgi:hypothetical protein